MGQVLTNYSDVSGDLAVTEERETDDGVETVTVDAIGTHTIAIDGVEHEYDSLDSEQNAIVKALERFLGEGFAKARPVAAKPSAAPTSRPRGKSTDGGRPGVNGLTREEGKMCRQWGRENGHEVSDRGRAPANVVEAWVAAGKPKPKTWPVSASGEAAETAETSTDEADGSQLEQDGATDSRDLQPA